MIVNIFFKTQVADNQFIMKYLFPKPYKACLLLSCLFSIFFSPQIKAQTELIPYRIQDKWGYSDVKGKLIIDPLYDEAGQFRADVTWVKKDGKFGFIKKDGTLLTDFEFDKAGYFYFGTARVSKDSVDFCIDYQGQRVVCRMGCGGSFDALNSFFTYKKADKIGIIVGNWSENDSGKRTFRRDTFPAIWDELKDNGAGYAAVKLNDKWAIINKKGNLTSGYEFNTAETQMYSKECFFKVSQNGKFGFLDQKGKPHIPLKYRKASFFEYGLAKVWVDDRFWGYIDRDGMAYFEQ